MERFGKEEERRKAIQEILKLYTVKDVNEAVKR